MVKLSEFRIAEANAIVHFSARTTASPQATINILVVRRYQFFMQSSQSYLSRDILTHLRSYEFVTFVL
jgi:hypothetical protein